MRRHAEIYVTRQLFGGSSSWDHFIRARENNFLHTPGAGWVRVSNVRFLLFFIWSEVCEQPLQHTSWMSRTFLYVVTHNLHLDFSGFSIFKQLFLKILFVEMVYKTGFGFLLLSNPLYLRNIRIKTLNPVFTQIQHLLVISPGPTFT